MIGKNIKTTLNHGFALKRCQGMGWTENPTKYEVYFLSVFKLKKKSLLNKPRNSFFPQL